VREHKFRGFASLASALVLGSCAAPAPPMCSESELNLWRLSAIGAMRTHLRYPEEGLREKLEGTVRVDVSVDATGRLVEATVAQSSGFTVLDTQALTAVHRATFPAPQCGGRARPMSHTIPLVFSLDGRAPTDSARDWVDRVRAKVRSNLLIPPGTPRNIEASFAVVQLPNGEVLSVRMLSSSGFKPYDEAIGAAIHKSSPLPVVAVPTLFRRELVLTFKP
jgi:TonB family protein